MSRGLNCHPKKMTGTNLDIIFCQGPNWVFTQILSDKIDEFSCSSVRLL